MGESSEPEDAGADGPVSAVTVTVCWSMSVKMQNEAMSHVHELTTGDPVTVTMTGTGQLPEPDAPAGPLPEPDASTGLLPIPLLVGTTVLYSVEVEMEVIVVVGSLPSSDPPVAPASEPEVA